MENNLGKLRELTNGLSTFPDAIENSGNGYKEYKMDKGVCFAWYIHRSGNDIAIHRWFNSEGSAFPEHRHKEKEWIIIYKGTMKLTTNTETKTLNTGDFIYFQPDVPHRAEFPTECRYITIMIPPASEFPN